MFMGTVERDATTGKHIAICETCGKRIERAKKEAAIWVMAQHMAYEHGQ